MLLLAEYTCLVTLLDRLEQDERQKMDQNNKGDLYRGYVEREVMFPLQRIRDLAETRAQQTKEVDHAQG